MTKWRAALEGLDGCPVDPTTERPAPARDVVMLLLAHILPALTANGDDQLVERGLPDLFARGTGAARQRAARRPVADLGDTAADLGHESLAAASQSGPRRPHPPRPGPATDDDRAGPGSAVPAGRLSRGQSEGPETGGLPADTSRSISDRALEHPHKINGAYEQAEQVDLAPEARKRFETVPPVDYV